MPSTMMDISVDLVDLLAASTSTKSVEVLRKEPPRAAAVDLFCAPSDAADTKLNPSLGTPSLGTKLGPSVADSLTNGLSRSHLDALYLKTVEVMMCNLADTTAPAHSTIIMTVDEATDESPDLFIANRSSVEVTWGHIPCRYQIGSFP